MDDAEMTQMLLEAFAQESAEQTQRITEALLALERETDQQARHDLLEQIFRDAHSLKGAARACDLTDIERIGHALESLFERIKSNKIDGDAATFDLTHRTLDAVKTLSTGEGEPVDVDELIGELQAAAEGAAPAAGEPKQPTRRRRPAKKTAASPAADPEPAPEPAAGAPDPAPPARQAATPKRNAAPKAPPQESVRVATSKLDSLGAAVGELLAARTGAEQRLVEAEALAASAAAAVELARRLPADGVTADQHAAVLDAARRLAGEISELKRHLDLDARRMGQLTSDLQEEVRRTRMLPVAGIFDTFPRMVRDLARKLGKEIDLVIEGGETEVDRTVLEQLKSPLQHMIRNCIDHGLETPEQRAANGKRPEGTLRLSASNRGARLLIEISDDGAGVDAENVKRSAVAKGLIDEAEADQMTAREGVALIFRSGFSTREHVSDVSGRGVGMDVVRETIERMHGGIDIETTVGQGTKFTLEVPLSVATAGCLLVQAGQDTYALPITNVERIVRVADGDMAVTDGRPALKFDDTPIAVTHLADVFGVPRAARADRQRRVAIIVALADKRCAMLVDQVLGSQEIAIKRLPAPMNRVRHIAGATILGTGEIVPILNAGDVLRTVANGVPALTAALAPSDPSPQAASVRAEPARVLVVDDSLTIRSLESTLLKAAGYEVVTASDGDEGWQALQREPFDVVVSDVEMPRLNGFELTERIRADQQLAHLPVVLVTSLSDDDDRARGVQAGADAYLVKGSAESEALLDTLARFVG